MKKIFLSLSLFIGCLVSGSSQILISYDHIQDLSTQDIIDLVDTSGPYEVSLYKVIYTVLDHNDALDTVSGLLAVPLDMPTESNLVVYCHGTSQDKQDVPSNLNSGYAEAVGFATNGFTTAASDYIGLGEATGFHPYVHARSEALSGLYFIDIAYTIMGELSVIPGPEFFIAGYSQGGHASMALQKLIETEFTPSTFPVTAAAHGSGPYSLSDVMLDVITGDEVYLPVGFVPFFILGYQEAYGDIYENLVDIFKPIYVPSIETFQAGNSDLFILSRQIAFNLISQNAAVIPKFMFQDSILARLQANDPTDRLIEVLRENNTYDFTATIPTRLYYCEADDIVPFENTIFADSVMQQLGATDLEIIHVNPLAGHEECAAIALPQVIVYFNSFINTSVAETKVDLIGKTYPNPVVDQFHIDLKNGPSAFDFRIFDTHGMQLVAGVSQDGATINISELHAGVYYFQAQIEGAFEIVKIVKI